MSQNRNWTIRAVAVFGIAALYYGVFILSKHGDGSGAIWFGLIGLPMSIGIGAQAILDPEVRQRTASVFLSTISVVVVLAIVLMAFAIETFICVVMALPIFLPLQWLGIFLTRHVLAAVNDRMRSKVQVSLLGLPVVLAALGFSPALPTTFETQTNSIIIAASPEVIWDNILDFPTVQNDERLWTISHNLLGAPAPIRSHVQGNIRPAEWTMGVSYEERMTVLDRPNRMNWDIHFAHDFEMPMFDQHIGPDTEQLELLDGGYVLTALPDGQTQVDLHTRYRLTTGFNAYVALWGARFLGDNHSAILYVLKLRSESPL